MPSINDYFDTLRGRRIAVLGMGVSNTPLIRMLLRRELDVTVRDKADRERLGEQAQELESLGARLRLGEDYLEDLDEAVIFRTPGVSPNTPQLRRAAERGSELTSEMELFFRACPCCLIGVTGSDGKTTTTTLIAEFLKAAGKNVYVGGNIGKPLLPDVDGMEPSDFAVLELSSFQLMTMEQSPHIAVFTNLSPNHLDYHGTMEEYIAAKENIFRHQREGDRAVFNQDNALTRDAARGAPAGVTWFSRRQRLEEGVYLRDGAIWLTNEQGSREVLPLSDIRLPGVHNVENYMAAIAAVDGLVPDRCVREVARRFSGVEHRIELVRELDRVRYYNDSIGTSPSRTIACLEAFEQKVILIAGGYDKGVPFTSLGLEIADRVKTLVLTGDTAKAIRDAVEAAPAAAPGHPDILELEDFAAAVKAARAAAEPGDIVVLSPACAAFDKFKNFMERGKYFKELVQQF
ncbi:MAG: UDP-N-acetylmuramoyl-L-alanine--D-glutamate ligase [Lawsonibacter sp.]|nr:UDP-N-acetylmuramoyl-L-alanine--D-glutamate ligase [Lawsonibacter sp.]